jgi:type II secretory pathway pseudopilin PulG
MIELVGVLAIIGILASILIPNIVKQVQKAKATTTVSLYKTLQAAVIDYNIDTGRFPIQYSSHGAGDAPDLANLTARPPEASGVSGWDGPYIDRPLITNEWGGLMNLDYSDFQFDLDGDGVDDTSGNNSYLRLSAVPEDAARRLDRLIDGTPDLGSGKLVVTGPAGNDQNVYILIAD